jgi:hypothetical protein
VIQSFIVFAGERGTEDWARKVGNCSFLVCGRKKKEADRKQKAIASYEPRLRAKLDLLIKQLHARTNESIDIKQWTVFYSFDVMGDIAFSQDFCQMETATEHYAISAIHAQMEQLGVLGAVPWLVHLLTCIPGLNGPYEKYSKYCSEKISQRRAVCKPTPQKTFRMG